MSPADIDQALRVMNIEVSIQVLLRRSLSKGKCRQPLYGHSSAHTPTFRRAVPQHTLSQSVYFLEDEEIDFDKALKEEVITVPPPVRYTGKCAISGAAENL